MSARMLQGSFLSVMQARTRQDFHDEVVRFADRLGFLYVSAMTVIDNAVGGESQFISVNNVPAGYSQVFNDRSQQRRDPVMQHCKRDAVPIVWDQDTYVSRGMGDVWEEQAAFGYRTGICLALHLPHGRHFLMGVDRARALPQRPEAITRLVADLQLFAVHALARPPGAHAARTRGVALDDGRQDRLGGGQHHGHLRAHGGAAPAERDAQARLRQQAPGGAEGVAAGPAGLRRRRAVTVRVRPTCQS